jgi:hypothetical protein
MFEIVYAESVADDLAELRAIDKSRILDRIDAQPPHQTTERIV